MTAHRRDLRPGRDPGAAGRRLRRDGGLRGTTTTIPVTVDDLIPLTAAVVAGTAGRWSVADLPFAPTRPPRCALAAATRFLKESGAHAVKLEGGERVARQVESWSRPASR